MAIETLRALHAVVIRRGIAGGHVHQAERRIRAESCPCIGRAAWIHLSCFERTGLGRPPRVPRPEQPPRDGVVGADDPARHVGRDVVGHGPADDDGVPHDRRRRCHALEAGRDITQAFAQRDRSALPEARAGLSGSGIKCEQSPIDGAEKDAPGAVRDRRPCFVKGHATTHQHAETGLVHVRIVAPALLAGVRIEGDHDVSRRAQKERVIHEYRGGLEKSGGSAVRMSRGDIPRAVLPCEREPMRVVRSDRGGRRVTRAR